MTTDQMLERAIERRRAERIEFSQRLVAELAPGDKIVYLDENRTIGSLDVAEDGSGHLIASFVDERGQVAGIRARLAPQRSVQLVTKRDRRAA